MTDDMDADSWPTPQEYGLRFAEVDTRLERSFRAAEYRGASSQELAELRYSLSKLALSAEDIRSAIGILEDHEASDEKKAHAVVELRNASGEVLDAFQAANDKLIALLNFYSD